MARVREIPDDLHGHSACHLSTVPHDIHRERCFYSLDIPDYQELHMAAQIKIEPCNDLYGGYYDIHPCISYTDQCHEWL
jgi:hypothetical protein